MMMYLESERVAALQRGEALGWAPTIQQTKTSLPKCSAYLHILAKCVDNCESPELVEVLNQLRPSPVLRRAPFE